MIIGKQFAEKLYSENQEKLYSTGNEELDNLLERAFCEGYELAQREYAYKPPMKPEKIREAIKEANKWGIKGKSLAQLSRSAARNLSSDAKGLTREQIQKGIREAGKEIGNKKTLASRVQPGQVSLIKKGLM